VLIKICLFFYSFVAVGSAVAQKVPPSWGKPVGIPYAKDPITLMLAQDLKMLVKFLRSGHDVVPEFSSRKHSIPANIDLFYGGKGWLEIADYNSGRAKFLREPYNRIFMTNSQYTGKKWTSLGPGKPIMLLMRFDLKECVLAIDIKGNIVKNVKL
jgi:hypothetical protein